MEEAKRFAVFVKEQRGDKEQFVKRPYDLIVGDSGTYLLPHHGVTRVDDAYDGVRIYDERPPWDIVR